MEIKDIIGDCPYPIFPCLKCKNARVNNRKQKTCCNPKCSKFLDYKRDFEKWKSWYQEFKFAQLEKMRSNFKR